MDQFLKLDWTTKTEDILINRYVNDERLRNESITYKILLGSFSNPFSDVRIQKDDTIKNPKDLSSLNLKEASKNDPEIKK